MSWRLPMAVRWYLRYGLSYRDVEELLAERGVDVDHVTVYRWVQRFTLWGPETRSCGLTRENTAPCWTAVSRVLYRLIAAARLAVRSGRSKDLEIIVLRHQLTVLRRQVDRPALNDDDDRSLLGAIAAALSRR